MAIAVLWVLAPTTGGHSVFMDGSRERDLMGVTGTTDMPAMGDGNWSSAGLADSREDERGGEQRRPVAALPWLTS